MSPDIVGVPQIIHHTRGRVSFSGHISILQKLHGKLSATLRNYINHTQLYGAGLIVCRYHLTFRRKTRQQTENPEQHEQRWGCFAEDQSRGRQSEQKKTSKMVPDPPYYRGLGISVREGGAVRISVYRRKSAFIVEAQNVVSDPIIYGKQVY